MARDGRFLSCWLAPALVCLIAFAPSLSAAEPATPAAAPAPTATAAPAATATPSVGETPLMRGLGVVTHFGRGPNWDADKILPLVRQMGVSVIRDGPEWGGIEKQKGVYAVPAECQHWYDAATKSGISIIYTFFRKNTIYENPLDPDACARYAAFMTKTWKSPGVCAYEVWNEPPNFDFPQQYKGAPGGWLPKYCEMVRKVTAAVKEVNPKAIVLENIEAGEWLEAVQKFPQDFAQIDGIDLHPYPKARSAESSPYGPPITDPQHTMVSYMTIAAIDYPKKYMGRELQMWVGEYGFPTMASRGGGWTGVTEEEQAAYQVRGLLLGIQAGVKAWCIYDMVNEGTKPTDNEDNMGLIRDITHNHEPKPAYYSLQRVARLMGPDWQLAPEAQQAAKLNVTLPAPAAPEVAAGPRGNRRQGGGGPSGPIIVWFSGVDKALIAYVWKAGAYIKDAPTLGTIVWTGAAPMTIVDATDLVTGQAVKVGISCQGNTVTLTDVPVGSNPVAIRLAPVMVR